MIDEDRDTAVGIEAKEPVFLLLVGHNVAEARGYVSRSCTTKFESARGNIHECLSPFGTIDVMQLLEHNLHLLPIGGTLCDKVKALGQILGPFNVE